MSESLITDLRTACANAMVWDRAELAGRDPGLDRRNFGAAALVRPSETAEVVSLVRFCAAHGLSLVAQGGRTGLAGGAATSPGQVICDLGAMAKVEEIDPFARVAIVQIVDLQLRVGGIVLARSGRCHTTAQREHGQCDARGLALRQRRRWQRFLSCAPFRRSRADRLPGSGSRGHRLLAATQSAHAWLR